MTDINYKEMLHEDTIFLTIDANDRDEIAFGMREDELL